MSTETEEDLAAEYSRSLIIPSYDVGPGDTLKLGSAMRLAQETGEQHLDRLGVGFEDLRKKTGLVFFMVSARIRIFRFPTHREAVRIFTRPRGQNKAEYYRDFRFFGAGDKPLLSVMQVTVLADAQTHRVKRVRDLQGFGPDATGPVKPDELCRRIRLPEGLAPLGERRVFRSDLDANSHMNNAVYGDIVIDFLPPEARSTAREIEINFVSEVSEGDVLHICGGKSGGKFYLSGSTGAGVSFTASSLL